MKKFLLLAFVASSASAYAAHPDWEVVMVHGEKAVATYDALNVAIDVKDTPKATIEAKKVGTLICGRITPKAEGEAPAGEVKHACAMAGIEIDHDHGDDDCDTGTGNQGGDQGTGDVEQILMDAISAN